MSTGGEFVAVVGPSGCGKSTLMKVVTGLWPATAGDVIVADQPVTGRSISSAWRSRIRSLLPWRTILENVMLPLEIVEPHASALRRERAAYEKKARDLLALVGLKGFEDKYPWQLSGGMQQRAQLCRALIHEPTLLMLDEPFGALDMFTREELWLALQDLWLARSPTVILVTHDLREAVFLADRVLVMSARPGRIILERKVDLPAAAQPEIDLPNRVRWHWCTTLREHISAARTQSRSLTETLPCPQSTPSRLSTCRPYAARKTFFDRKAVRRVLPWVVIIVMFGLWEFFVRIFQVQQFVLPAPSAIFESLWQWRWIDSRELLADADDDADRLRHRDRVRRVRRRRARLIALCSTTASIRR